MPLAHRPHVVTFVGKRPIFMFVKKFRLNPATAASTFGFISERHIGTLPI